MKAEDEEQQMIAAAKEKGMKAEVEEWRMEVEKNLKTEAD